MSEGPTLYGRLLKYRFSFILAVLSMAGLLLAFGFYFEEWQAFMNLTINGDICVPPLHEIFFSESWFLQIPLLAYLSDHFANVPVFGIWCLIIITLYLSLWYYLGFRILSRSLKKPGWLLFANFVFTWCIMGICLVNINCTRDSVLLTASSLLLYFDIFVYEDKKQKRYLFLFLLGCSMRVNPAVLVLSAMTLFCLLYFRDIRKTFQLLKWYWLFTLLSFALVIGVSSTAKDLGPKLEGFEYPVMGKNAVVPLSAMKSAADTMRYRALNEYFLVTDTAQITIPFIKTVVDETKYRRFGIDQEDLMHMMFTLAPLLVQYWLFFLLGYALLVVALFYTNLRILTNVLIVNLSGWLLVLVFAMKISMPERFLLPWFSMMLGMSYLLASIRPWTFRRWQKNLFLLLGLWLVIWDMNMLQGFARDGMEQKKRSHEALGKLEALSKSSVPVIWDHHLGYIPNDVLARRESRILRSSIYLSIYRIQFYDFGQDRSKERFGFSPLDMRKMNEVLNGKADSIRFITEESSAEFLSRYYKSVYNMDFNLVKEEPVNEVSPELFVYRLRRVSLAVQ